MAAARMSSNVVDSSAWLAYFAGERSADVFAAPIEDTGRLVVPSICVLEVFKVLLRERGEEDALVGAAAMHKGRVVELDAALALDAARLGVELRLPLADSVVYATAKLTGAQVWTQDEHFAALPGVHYVEKRRSRSR
ncbi:MAG: type II toxin-antitoxin system VapC family toxin [Gemmatimonadaceae bacterium]